MIPKRRLLLSLQFKETSYNCFGWDIYFCQSLWAQNLLSDQTFH